ncbi:MAG: hypothetical protein U0Z26_05135 [Anaerolineales bacterium]
MPTIMFNGKTYNSIEEMPANERLAFEQVSNMLVDKNGNGIPDFLEGDIAKNVMSVFTSSVNINGKTYSGIDELPEDVRQRIQGAFEKLNQHGMISKTSDHMIVQTKFNQTTGALSEPFVSKEYAPAIQEEESPNLKWLFLAIAGLAICLLFTGAAIFFLYR